MVAGIVCEYNPMHNGHVYQIKKTRERGADHVVCAMSGNFVQRGECASLSKWVRAKMAIENGADVVIEIPTAWASNSAETFARGAVGLLDAFGVDTISFGSEIDDTQKLLDCAKAFQDDTLMQKIKALMKTGVTYPVALSLAFEMIFDDDFSFIISNPNATLALEYIKQIQLINPKIAPMAIKREGVSHDAQTVSENFASASKLRNMDFEPESFQFMPEKVSQIVQTEIDNGCAPCKLQNIETAILAKLRTMSKAELSEYINDEKGLVTRIFDSVKVSTSLEKLYENTKTKAYTHSRVRREILSAFLGIKKNVSNAIPPYIKVLAVSENGMKLIKSQKTAMKLPLITKYSELKKLDDFAKELYTLECQATDIFALCSPKIRPCSLEQTNSIIVIK